MTDSDESGSGGNGNGNVAGDGGDGGGDSGDDSGGSVVRPLSIAVLTVSDTRDRSTDKSGDFLERAIRTAGHRLVARELVKDDRQQIGAVLKRWRDNDAVEVAITTGGTGITARDITPEVVRPLLDKELAGFGELFRHLSFAQIGASSIQSRALGGVMGRTLLFVLPGSVGACRCGWTGILEKQLDIRTQPCNFVELQERL